jgi:hypothetical protein
MRPVHGDELGGSGSSAALIRSRPGTIHTKDFPRDKTIDAPRASNPKFLGTPSAREHPCRIGGCLSDGPISTGGESPDLGSVTPDGQLPGFAPEVGRTPRIWSSSLGSSWPGLPSAQRSRPHRSIRCGTRTNSCEGLGRCSVGDRDGRGRIGSGSIWDGTRRTCHPLPRT